MSCTRAGLLFWGVRHVARLRIQVRGADFPRRLRGCVGDYVQVLAWKFFRHFREHAAHQIGDSVHLDAAIENQAELVLLVQQGPIDRPLLRIRRADPIQEICLALFELSAAA